MTPRTIPTPRVTEAEWADTFTLLLRSLGWKSMHARASRGRGGRGAGWVTAISVVGWPDYVCWNEQQERLIFVELKAEAGKLSDAQTAVLASLRAAGCSVYVWRPSDFEEAVRVLRGTA